MNILAVIPARGGSKGIPRKNVRLMNGKPLIYYSIENAKKCTAITDIVVTSDDDEIIGLAQLENVDYIVREKDLAGDKITLDPVVYDAVVQMEHKKNLRYDAIVTIQPTSPLLKWTTLENAIDKYRADKKDTYISVVNKPHLSWSKKGSKYIPNYSVRLNRQELPANFVETGSFLITKRECVDANNRIGRNVTVFEIPADQAVDIDGPNDWIICEFELKKKKIVFRTDGYKKIGMGHIYRCLTLAYKLVGHDIVFVCNEKYSDGINKIKNSFMSYKIINSDIDFFDFLHDWKADIVVNDCLDTEVDYIKRLKTLVNRVITIEDLGEGAKYADVIINALYGEHKSAPNLYAGEKYICLRDEFLINKPRDFSSEVRNVLVLFGGTDPSNLTKKLYDLALRLADDYPEIKFTFISGSGYNCAENDVYTVADKNIYVLSDVKRVSDYMIKSDLAFTSQGRTVFELATLGIPSIVLAQNEREQLHTFANMQNGFVNLGLGRDISIDTIESTFKWLVETEQIRREMRDLMLKHKLKLGINRVIDIILEED